MESSAVAFPLLKGSVWVGSFEFKVYPVQKPHPRFDGPEGIPDDDALEGLTHFEPLTEIYYDIDRPPRQVFDTILHELTHAVNHAFLPDSRLTEEKVATAHGKGWTQVFLDNPKLVRWIAKATKFIRDEQSKEAASE